MSIYKLIKMKEVDLADVPESESFFYAALSIVEEVLIRHAVLPAAENNPEPLSKVA